MSEAVSWTEYVALVPFAWSKGNSIEHAVVGAALRRHKSDEFEFVVHMVEGSARPNVEFSTPLRAHVRVDDMGTLHTPKGSSVTLVARGAVSVDAVYDDDNEYMKHTTIKITATELPWWEEGHEG